MSATNTPCCPVQTCAPICVHGTLLPVAFAPGAPAGTASAPQPVMDCLVTRVLAAGTQLVFRFYPQADGYLSPLATAVGFVLGVAVFPGMWIRVAVSDTQMLLSARASGGTWMPAAAPSLPCGYPPNATCALFLLPSGSGNACGGPGACVSAIGQPSSPGELPPVFPPSSVLPCQYAFTMGATSSSSPVTMGYFQRNPTTLDSGVPGEWADAWRLLRWSAGWGIGDLGAHTYDALVTPVEDAVYIRVLPGAWVPIAFRPYTVPPTDGCTPWFAVWAVACTLPIPGNTTVSLSANNWEDSTPSAPWFSWTAPETGVPAGTVLLFQNLGSLTRPTVTCGSVETGSGFLPNTDIHAITAYSYNPGTDSGDAVTGTYTCSYAGVVPPVLVPGVAIQGTPWPDCPAIADLLRWEGCRGVQDVLGVPLVPWVTQTCPSSFRCPVPACAGTGPCAIETRKARCSNGCAGVPSVASRRRL